MGSAAAQLTPPQFNGDLNRAEIREVGGGDERLRRSTEDLHIVDLAGDDLTRQDSAKEIQANPSLFL
jgi:hypothetical protein